MLTQQPPIAPATIAPEEKEPYTTPMESEQQLRALLHGDLRMLWSLYRKGIESVAARFHFRRATRLGRYVRLHGRPYVVNRGTLIIGNRVNIYSTTVRCEFVVYRGGSLEIGDRSVINYGTSIAAHKSIRIGADCLIGPYTNILDNNYHDIINHALKPPSRPVTIGDDVWIAGRAVILPGVTIGDHAVIGAGAVVMEDVPERSVVVGNPAKVVASF